MRKGTIGKTSKIDLIILSLSSKKPICSKEVAEIMNNPKNHRNIQDKIRKLEQTGFLKRVNHEDDDFPHSDFFAFRGQMDKDIFSVTNTESTKKKQRTILYVKSSVGIKNNDGMILNLWYELLLDMNQGKFQVFNHKAINVQRGNKDDNQIS